MYVSLKTFYQYLTLAIINYRQYLSASIIAHLTSNFFNDKRNASANN